MNIVEIIEKKKNKIELTKKEIKYVVDGFVSGGVKDYQAAAFAMAVWFNGMTSVELAAYTESMMLSGDIIDLTSIDGIKVDKHSTGGVGDKVTLIVGPIVASLGAPVAKMSGRGLGFTGGTIDKLESIPGMKVMLPIEAFIEQVKKTGLAVVGQTPNLVPGDMKFYALRDVTGTVDSIPLIAASIMSKKLATGSNAILLDVKCGDAAFMKTIESAKELGSTMIKIGKELNRDVRVEITSMDKPLGREIGNKNEVLEAYKFLRGEYSDDLDEVIFSSAASILVMSKIYSNEDEAMAAAKEAINNGKALAKFEEWISAQGGDIELVKSDNFWTPKHTFEIKSKESGFMNISSAIEIGLIAMELGAGRKTKEDDIDFNAGITLVKKSGESVAKDDVVIRLHSDSEITAQIIERVEKAFEILEVKVNNKVILDRLW